MSLLHITYDGISVTPMRPETGKTFSDADVPSGTDSVYYIAAKVLKHSHGKSIDIPELTQGEIDTLVTTQEGNISTVAGYTAGEEDKTLLDRTEILNPSSDEITVELARKDGEGEDIHADSDAATAYLIATRKTEIAAAQIEERKRGGLDVPTLSQDFKDLFTTEIT